MILTSFERWESDMFLTDENYKLSDLHVTYNNIRDDVGTSLFFTETLQKRRH